MMKEYIKPKTQVVKLNLTGSILIGEPIAGQSKVPVSVPSDPGDIEWSAKKNGFFDEDENEEWPKSNSPWE